MNIPYISHVQFHLPRLHDGSRRAFASGFGIYKWHTQFALTKPARTYESCAVEVPAGWQSYYR